MSDDAVVKFSHVKPGDTEFKSAGLRDFFLYRQGQIGYDQQVYLELLPLVSSWHAPFSFSAC